MVDWQQWEQVGLVIDAGSGGLFIVLGLLVAFVRPLTPTGFSFGTFAVAFGANRLYLNIAYFMDAPFDTGFYVIGGSTMLIGAVAMMRLAFHFPIRYTARRDYWVPLLPLVPLLLWVMIDHAWAWGSTSQELNANPFAVYVGILSYDLMSFAFAAFAILAADRWGRCSTLAQRQVALTSGAHILTIAGASAFALLGTIDNGPRLSQDYWNAGTVLLAPYVCLVWLRAADKHRSRAARTVALFGLSTMAATVAFIAWVPVPITVSQNLGILGLGRIMAVVILAYAIAKSRLFDIDVKIKAGIGQSTVAAIFVAGFFVVSELAAGILSERIGLVAGVATTGALVFALAPLQRFGQRVADVAMPNAMAWRERSEPERLHAYREMAAAAWQDGVLSRAERNVLQVARTQLGLTAKQADEVESAL